ncbi:hypothetical protein N7508_004125 [Penicillium antarcticum]|nr:uncharacterized protein N7508_004125 [Penicillium antarcticum]KAJ5308746.1 hypothetical protein N7508_004125 [Penicillium antarcticum]
MAFAKGLCACLLRCSSHITEEDRKDYKEQWADELQELVALDIAPVRVSLKDFPRLKNLSIGAHTLCYLARNTGDGKKQLDLKSFNLVDHIPSTLRSLQVYGHGQSADNPYLDYESDLDINAQIEQLAREQGVKLRGLMIFGGVDPCISNGRTVDERSDDNRFDEVDDDVG